MKKRGTFTQDSLILTDFVILKGTEKVIELGSGPGIILKLLHKKFPKIKLTGIELDKDTHECSFELLSADRTVNQRKIKLINYDLRKIKDILKPHSFDVVVSNLPYYKSNSGRKSPDKKRRIARSDELFTIQDFCRTLNYLLVNSGAFFSIFTASRFYEFLKTLELFNLKPEIVKFIYSKNKARVFLVKGRKGKFKQFTIVNG